jgi:hypothetical protein
MKSSFRIIRSLALVLFPAAAGVTALGDPVNGTLYFTTYNGGVNIHKVDYNYNGAATFALAAPVDIGSTAGADGIVFNPNNGNLLIGGQGFRIHEMTTAGVLVSTKNPNTDTYHLSVDPSKTIVWAGGIPSGLAEVPLTPGINNGIAYTMSGPDTVIDSLAWRGNTIVYTSSGGGGNGNWGTIVINTAAKTATTTRLGSMPATHGVSYDPYTDDFIFNGANHITQVDGATLVVQSDLTIPNVQLDQGAVDGKGHAFIASNTGNLVFLDYSTSHLVSNAANFLASPFLANFLDDVAPIAGPGGNPNPNVPEANTVFAGVGVLIAAGLVWRRSRRQAHA